MTLWSTGILRFALSILVFWASISSNAQAQNSGGALSVDDMLNLEAMGEVYTLSDGRIVYEYLPPYQSRSSFGFDDPRANSRIMTVDPGASSARSLFRANPSQGYMIASFSPTERRVAIYAATIRDVSGLVVDVKTGRRTKLGYAPYADFYTAQLLWLSDDELLYSTTADSYPALVTGTRIPTAESYTRRWNEAFEGKTPTADSMRSRPLQGASEPIAGSLIRADARTGVGKIVAEGVFTDLAARRDGSFVAALQREGTRDVAPRAFVDRMFISKLRVISLSDGRVFTPCEPCEVVPESIAWRTQDGQLVFFARDRGDPWTKGHYYQYELGTGELKTIARASTDFMPVSSSQGSGKHRDNIPYTGVPMARGIAAPIQAGSNDKRENRVEWHYLSDTGISQNLSSGLEQVSAVPVSVNDRSVVVLADGDLWKLSIEETRSNLTRTIPPISAVLSTTSNVRNSDTPRLRRLGQALIEFKRDERTSVSVINLDDGLIHDLTARTNDQSVVALSPTSPSAVLVQSDGNGIQVTKLRSGERAATPFAKLNDFLRNVMWPQQRSIAYKVKGEAVTACVYQSAANHAKTLSPILVYVYPDVAAEDHGCTETVGNAGPDYPTRVGYPDIYRPRYLADLGYTVVVPSTPAKLIHSDEESLANLNAVVEPAVDATAAAGLGDGRRVGLFGVSQGGYAVLKILTQSQRYIAGIAMFSNADFASDYVSIGSTRAMLSRQLFTTGRSWWFAANGIGSRSTPWTDPEWFVRSSPYFSSERITAPLLLVQSDLDTNFQMSQFDEIFTSLYIQNRSVDYIRYWGEGHGLTSPANIRDLNARLTLWLHDKLGNRVN